MCQGCEILIRETPDGALSLADTFVIDEASGTSSPVTARGDIPAHPRFYQDAEVAIEYAGNVFENKDPKRTVVKIYFAAIQSLNPFELSLDEFYLLDSTKRTMERLAVVRLAPPDTPDIDLRARIRDRSVVIDTIHSIPNPEQVVQAALQGGTAISVLEKEAKERGLQQEEEEHQRQLQRQQRQEGEGDEDGEVVGVGVENSSQSGDEEEDDASLDILYDDDTLKDFQVEVDPDLDTDFDDEDDDVGEYDMPASDY